jgi:hypothetical protein
MTQRAERVERVLSNWTDLLVASRIADLHREAERERLAKSVRRRRAAPALGRTGSVRAWLRTGVAHVVGALLRRSSTDDGAVPFQSESCQS